jgi:hypothetical protein
MTITMMAAVAAAQVVIAPLQAPLAAVHPLNLVFL